MCILRRAKWKFGWNNNINGLMLYKKETIFYCTILNAEIINVFCKKKKRVRRLRGLIVKCIIDVLQMYSFIVYDI